MTIILFDTPQTHQAFYPLTLTRPVASLRQGIFSVQERWQQLRVVGVSGSWRHEPGLGISKDMNQSEEVQVFTLGETYLHLTTPPADESYLYIDVALLPTSIDIEGLSNLATDEGWIYKERLIAVKTDRLLSYPVQMNLPEGIQLQELKQADFLQTSWQLFQTNAKVIATDYKLLTTGRTSQPINATNVITGGSDIFIEPGAVVKGCFINAAEGPVYIGKDALVMEGTSIRGPVAVCNNAVVKMGAKLYGGTTIGPHCTAGGEIKNAILSGYSNKAHDGYLGDAVIGEWCNLGAGTTNSNVKNTGGEVNMWSETAQDFIPVGKKAGLIMGDYSRSAINTGFNTGTTVGVCCNVFGNSQPPKHVSSFTWGNEQYRFDKALTDINNWKTFKGKKLEEGEKQMLNALYQSQLPATEI